MDEITTVAIEENKKGFPIWRILYRNLVLIIAIIILCGAIGTILGFVTVKDSYTAKTNVMFKVSATGASDNAADMVNNNTLAKKTLKSAISIIKMPDVIERARFHAQDENLSANAIGIGYDEDSLIFTVTYTQSGEDEDLAKAVAQTRLKGVVTAIKEDVSKYNFPGVDKVEFVETMPVNNGGLVQYEITKTNMRSSYILIGFGGGLVLAIGVALLRFILDNKVKDTTELEEITNAGILAVIDK